MSFNYQGTMRYSNQHSILQDGPTQSRGQGVASVYYKISGTGVTTNSAGGQCAETTHMPGFKIDGNAVDNVPSNISTYINDGSGIVPSWANKCSIIMVGGGGGGRSGSQGFQKNMFQSKNSQSGRRGGSGGGGGIVFLKDMVVTGGEAFQVGIGRGGAAGNYQGGASSGNAAQDGGTTQLSFPNGTAVLLKANGGGAGNGGSTNGGDHGVSGNRGTAAINHGTRAAEIRNGDVRVIAGAHRNNTNQNGHERNAGGRPVTNNQDVSPIIFSQTSNFQRANQVEDVVNQYNSLSNGYGTGGFGGAQGPSDGKPSGFDNGGNGRQGFVRIFWHNH